MVALVGAATDPKAEAAVAITVNTTVDEMNGCEAGAGCSLREALAEIEPSGTVGLPAGTYTLTLGSELEIVKPLTLGRAGPGTAIVQAAASPGTATHRLFHVFPEQNVTFSDLTIRHGRLVQSEFAIGGGAIYNQGRLTLNRCIVTHNAVEGANGISENGINVTGGGLYNQGTLTLRDSMVTENTARGGDSVSGLGGQGEAAGIFNNGTLLTLTNTTVSSNLAQGGNTITGDAGGAVAGGLRSITSATMTSSTISNNIAQGGQSTSNNGGSGQAGGMDNGGTMTATDTTISGNSARGGISLDVGSSGGAGLGGGIYNQLGRLQLTRCTISGNTAESQNVFGASVQAGGGLLVVNDNSSNHNTSATLSNCTISGNSGTSIGFGSISGGGLSHVSVGNSTSTVTLRSCTITSNSVGGEVDTATGGGLSNFVTDGSTATTILSNTILAGNSAPASADCDGTVISEAYNLILDDSGCTITGDTSGNIVSQDPLIGKLTDNGGQTQTHALDPNSPAVDAANPAAPGSGGNACPSQDQRDYGRPGVESNRGAARCDIGAFELGGVPPSPTPTPLPLSSPPVGGSVYWVIWVVLGSLLVLGKLGARNGRGQQGSS